MTININGTTGISGVDGSAGTPAIQGTDANTGISFPAADTVAISTNGSERSRVDSSGRLLVGTSSTSVGSAGAVVFQGGDAGGNNAFMVLASKTATPASGDDLGIISFNDSAHIYNNALIRAQRDGGTWTATTSKPTRLVFSTTPDSAASPVERLRITNGGDFYFNTTVSTKTSEGFRIENAGVPNVSRGTGGSFMIFFAASSGSQIGSITNNGGTATAYNTSSDYRLKENVTSVTDGITRLQQLKPCRFNFKADPSTAVDGFIAHEVQAVIPEAITGEKDAVDDDGNPIYQGIDQSKLVPLLTAALQEAVAKIETLEARLTAAGIA